MIRKTHFVLSFAIVTLMLGMNDAVFAQNEDNDMPMVASTDVGSVDVELSWSPTPLEPDQETRLHIRFLQPDTDVVQIHIDYKIFIESNGREVFRIPLTHTNPGIVTIPYTFTNVGDFIIGVEVEGILFQPIPMETAMFSVVVVPEFPIALIVMAGAVAGVLLFTRTRLIPNQLRV